MNQNLVIEEFSTLEENMSDNYSKERQTQSSKPIQIDQRFSTVMALIMMISIAWGLIGDCLQLLDWKASTNHKFMLDHKITEGTEKPRP